MEFDLENSKTKNVSANWKVFYIRRNGENTLREKDV